MGRSVIVTGANCGLGLETARVLVNVGAHVVLACRSTANAEAAVASIRAQTPPGCTGTATPLVLDLGSFASIRAFVAAFLALGRPLHILVNNAGVMACPLSRTADGLEMQMGVNHFGHFLLTTLLLPALKASAPARVICLSSTGHFLFPPATGIDWANIGGEHGYDMWRKYGESKLANVLFAVELNRRMAAEGVDVKAIPLHPGAILGTNLSRHFGFGVITRMLGYPRVWRIICGGIPNKTIPQGTSTTIVAALAPDASPGRYYSDCAEEEVMVHPLAYDVEQARRLWEVSLVVTAGAAAAPITPTPK
jgi:NAD(P)-dependent dehydrogenase (short-subunit alcohol dehydrogenase family)